MKKIILILMMMLIVVVTQVGATEWPDTPELNPSPGKTPEVFNQPYVNEPIRAEPKQVEGDNTSPETTANVYNNNWTYSLFNIWHYTSRSFAMLWALAKTWCSSTGPVSVIWQLFGMAPQFVEDTLKKLPAMLTFYELKYFVNNWVPSAISKLPEFSIVGRLQMLNIWNFIDLFLPISDLTLAWEFFSVMIIFFRGGGIILRWIGIISR